MSQQGDGRHRREDEWWRRLYGDRGRGQTGPSPDTLDDRYASALRAVGRPSPGPSFASDVPPRRGAPREPDQGRLEPVPDSGTAGGPEQAPAPQLPPGWAAADPPPSGPERVPAPARPYVGDRPPTYAAEPTAWPAADPDDLDDLIPDTVLDGARYGVMTVRTVSVRGDSARYRGGPRRDALLTARFGSGDDALLLIAVASGARAAEQAHRAAQDACRSIAAAVGRSQARLAQDIRAARRGSLKSGLHRLTDRCYGRLRARGEDLGLADGQYTAALRCLLLPVDPACRIRLSFGVGDGGLFRIRAGDWQDLDPARDPAADARTDAVTDADPAVGVTPAMDAHAATGVDPVTGEDATGGTVMRDATMGGTGRSFRFRASVAHPGDALLLCSPGMAAPLRGEPELADRLAARWGTGEPPGLTAFLTDVQTRVKGYADDRTAVAVWDA